MNTKHALLASARRRRLPPVAMTRREERALRSAAGHHNAALKFGEVAVECHEKLTRIPPAMQTPPASFMGEFLTNEFTSMRLRATANWISEGLLAEAMRMRARRERRRAERRAGR